MKCPHCGAVSAPGTARCEQCQAPLATQCISCGAPVPVGVDLCDNCRTERAVHESSQAEVEAPSAEEQLPTLRSPYVGRMEQLQQLKEMFLKVREEGSLAMATVVGEPGSGKSRLAVEFCRSVRAAITDTRVLCGLSGGRAAPTYGPILEVLRERFGIARSEHLDDARAKIEACVAEAVPERKQEEISHLIAHLMGLPYPNSPVLEPLAEVPGQLEVRAFIAVRRFLERDAEKGAILVQIDAAERAGAETVNLLHYLAEGLRHCPVFIVVTARPTLFRRHPQWGQGEFPHHRVDLAPMSAEDAEKLFTSLTHLAEVPEELLQVTRNRLGGNPRAIEDLARYLLESGLLRPNTGTWTLDLSRVGVEGLPRTHEEILRARLRALPADQQSVLRKAAAVGETFWLDAVVALVRARDSRAGDPDGPSLAEIAESGEQGREFVSRQLTALRKKGLITATEQSTITGELEFSFAYPPLWDLGHELLSEETARRYHALVAQWLELRPEGRTPERQEEAGRHLQRAGDMLNAGSRFRRAADLYRARYLNDKAIRLYLRALACVGGASVAARMHLWHDLGNVYQLKGELDKALDSFERVLRLSWVVASRPKGAVAFNKMGRVWRQKGNLDLALEYLERGRELFRQAGDRRGLATSLDDIGQTYWMMGRYDEALDFSAKALEMRRKLRDKRAVATSLANIGNIEKDRGLFREAESCYHEAMELRREVGDRYGFVMSLNNLGTLAFERADLQQARDYWEDSLTEAEQIGAVPLQVALLVNLSETALQMGKLADARAGIDRAMTLASEIEDKRSYTTLLRNLALVELRDGNRERAKQRAEQCLELAKKYRMQDLVGRAHMALAEVFGSTVFDESGHGSGRSTALDHFNRAIKTFRKMGNEAQLARALRRVGEFQVEKGEMEAGLAALREAVEIFQRLDIPAGDEVLQILAELG